MPSKEKAKKSIEKSKNLLEQAKKSFNVNAFDSCLITGYQAIFLSARAVLLKDGYREKSHACVARYLEEKYVKTGKLEMKWVDLFDRFRDLRHSDQYDVFFSATKKECEDILRFGKIFIRKIEELLK